VDSFLAQRLKERDDWGKRFDALVERIQTRVPVPMTPEQVEADITAAREEVRDAHRAARAKSRSRSR
jgi:hypothetical protein